MENTVHEQGGESVCVYVCMGGGSLSFINTTVYKYRWVMLLRLMNFFFFFFCLACKTGEISYNYIFSDVINIADSTIFKRKQKSTLPVLG